MSKEMPSKHMPNPWLAAEARVVYEGTEKEPSRLQQFIGNRIHELELPTRPYNDICGIANAMVQMAMPGGVRDVKSADQLVMAQAIMEIHKKTVPVIIPQLAKKVCIQEPILERYFPHDTWDKESLATSLGLVHAIGPYLGDFSAFDKQLPSGTEAQAIYFRRSALSLMIDPEQMQRGLNTVYIYGVPTIAEYLQREYSGVFGALTMSMEPTHVDTLAALERCYVNGWQVSQSIMRMLGCKETQFTDGKGTESFHSVANLNTVQRMLGEDISVNFGGFYAGAFPLLEIEMYRSVWGYQALRPVGRQLLSTAQLHGVRDHIHSVGKNSNLNWLAEI